MAHPAKMKAISAGKKKSDTIDARTIADLLRCNLLPACYVAPPRIRELRRLLRYRSLLVGEAVRMKNKMAGLLMETGALYVKEKLHRKKYFASLLEELEEVPESVIDLLRLSRGALEMLESTQKRLVRELLADAELAATRRTPDEHSRSRRNYRSHLGAGGRRSTALSLWLRCHELLRTDRRLEVLGGQAATRPISKQRNHWLQTTLIEAAKLAPRWNFIHRLPHASRCSKREHDAVEVWNLDCRCHAKIPECKTLRRHQHECPPFENREGWGTLINLVAKPVRFECR